MQSVQQVINSLQKNIDFKKALLELTRMELNILEKEKAFYLEKQKSFEETPENERKDAPEVDLLEEVRKAESAH